MVAAGENMLMEGIAIYYMLLVASLDMSGDWYVCIVDWVFLSWRLVECLSCMMQVGEVRCKGMDTVPGSVYTSVRILTT